VAALIKQIWSIRLVRFLVIGAVNTAFSYLIYALLVLIGLHYSLATLISTVLGIIFNFFTTGRIVFRNMDNRRFIRFILVYAFTYLVNVLFLKGLVEGLSMDKLLAGALVTLPVALLSYYLNSIWTFRNSTSNEGAIHA
jgi:putative flippase GtrA